MRGPVGRDPRDGLHADHDAQLVQYRYERNAAHRNAADRDPAQRHTAHGNASKRHATDGKFFAGHPADGIQQLIVYDYRSLHAKQRHKDDHRRNVCSDQS
jgi:hypothetical protein